MKKVNVQLHLWDGGGHHHPDTGSKLSFQTNCTEHCNIFETCKLCGFISRPSVQSLASESELT